MHYTPRIEDVPGLNHYPDLASRFRQEVAAAGCCGSNSIIRKYAGMVELQQRGDQKKLVIPRRIR